MRTTHNNISAKALRLTEEALRKAIEGTADLAGVFSFLNRMNGEGRCILDGSAMSECEAMLATANRLLYEQQSRLQHLHAMQEMEHRVDVLVSRVREEESSSVSQLSSGRVAL